MFCEYIHAALSKATYEIIEDEEPFYGEISELRGVWAIGKNLEECRENLRGVVEGWIALRLRLGLAIPHVGGRTRTENQAMLDDQEDFTALSAKLISDLIDGEPDTGHLPDMIIRFR
ncbi:MAG: type II toxin-antitoxin system HicB family antitoxin [Methanothrix sp.]